MKMMAEGEMMMKIFKMSLFHLHPALDRCQSPFQISRRVNSRELSFFRLGLQRENFCGTGSRKGEVFNDFCA